MNRLVPSVALAFSLLAVASASSAAALFDGLWTIDIRTPAERQRGAQCGTAEFVLIQVGEKITGEHSMAVSGCGRINEGGLVKGVVVGTTAVLTVTSGRNGAIALGTAKVSNGRLQWRTIEEIKTGDLDGDSPLILDSGSLVRATH